MSCLIVKSIGVALKFASVYSALSSNFSVLKYFKSTLITSINANAPTITTVTNDDILFLMNAQMVNAATSINPIVLIKSSMNKVFLSSFKAFKKDFTDSVIVAFC